MNYTEAKEKIDALLTEAKEKLDSLGIAATAETELVENKISETESEPLMILGSIALTMDGLEEDDTYYVSIEARIEGGEVNSEALAEAEPKFKERISAAYERLAASENKRATLLEMGKEVDEEMERIYREEVEREARAMKRDLKIAIIGSAVLVLIVAAAVLIKLLV